MTRESTTNLKEQAAAELQNPDAKFWREVTNMDTIIVFDGVGEVLIPGQEIHKDLKLAENLYSLNQTKKSNSSPISNTSKKRTPSTPESEAPASEVEILEEVYTTDDISDNESQFSYHKSGSIASSMDDPNIICAAVTMVVKKQNGSLAVLSPTKVDIGQSFTDISTGSSNKNKTIPDDVVEDYIDVVFAYQESMQTPNDEDFCMFDKFSFTKTDYEKFDRAPVLNDIRRLKDKIEEFEKLISQDNENDVKVRDFFQKKQELFKLYLKRETERSNFVSAVIKLDRVKARDNLKKIISSEQEIKRELSNIGQYDEGEIKSKIDNMISEELSSLGVQELDESSDNTSSYDGRGFYARSPLEPSSPNGSFTSGSLQSTPEKLRSDRVIEPQHSIGPVPTLDVEDDYDDFDIPSQQPKKYRTAADARDTVLGLEDKVKFRSTEMNKKIVDHFISGLTHSEQALFLSLKEKRFINQLKKTLLSEVSIDSARLTDDQIDEKVKENFKSVEAVVIDMHSTRKTCSRCAKYLYGMAESQGTDFFKAIKTFGSEAKASMVPTICRVSYDNTQRSEGSTAGNLTGAITLQNLILTKSSTIKDVSLEDKTEKDARDFTGFLNVNSKKGTNVPDYYQKMYKGDEENIIRLQAVVRSKLSRVEASRVQSEQQKTQ